MPSRLILRSVPALGAAVDKYDLWAALLHKARESSLLAVETFNRPTAEFRTGAYTSLMIIAWTSLLLSAIVRGGGVPYELHPTSEQPLLMPDGSKKFLCLTDCLGRYFVGGNPPVTANLKLFISLRNRIEHAEVPGLDQKVFGEAQALLLNFEGVLTKEFGRRFSLPQGLAFPVTFSYVPPVPAAETMRRRLSSDRMQVLRFIDEYRSSLTAGEIGSQAYSFRVFLLPRIGNHQGSADVAVQWVDMATLAPDQVDEYEHQVAALLKVKQVCIADNGLLRAGAVANRVAAALGCIFTASTHHSKACKKLGAWIKGKKPTGPTECDSRYCVWSEPYADCLYTKTWVDRLIEKLSNRDIQIEVFGSPLNPPRTR
jgi:hypothetical protein